MHTVKEVRVWGAVPPPASSGEKTQGEINKNEERGKGMVVTERALYVWSDWEGDEKSAAKAGESSESGSIQRKGVGGVGVVVKKRAGGARKAPGHLLLNWLWRRGEV